VGFSAGCENGVSQVRHLSSGEVSNLDSNVSNMEFIFGSAEVVTVLTKYLKAAN